MDGEVFSKPGQRFPTPSPGSGARVFYETLLQEKPECLMALQWCVDHGIAHSEKGEAEAMYKRLRAKLEGKGGSRK